MIQFRPSNFWDNQTMNIGDAPNALQWAQVENICNALNDNYIHEIGCIIHPERTQIIQVGIFNKKIDFQVAREDTCGCLNIIERLLEIRNIESARATNLNP